MHLLDEVRSNRNIVVLNEDRIVLLREKIGDLLRNSNRAATAQEEVVSLTGSAWHGSATLVLSMVTLNSAGRQGVPPARISASHEPRPIALSAARSLHSLDVVYSPNRTNAPLYHKNGRFGALPREVLWRPWCDLPSSFSGRRSTTRFHRSQRFCGISSQAGGSH